ncbi:hypothetical protein EG864_15445, partial [Enterococcus faecalis]
AVQGLRQRPHQAHLAGPGKGRAAGALHARAVVTELGKGAADAGGIDAEEVRVLVLDAGPLVLEMGHHRQRGDGLALVGIEEAGDVGMAVIAGLFADAVVVACAVHEEAKEQVGVATV